MGMKNHTGQLFILLSLLSYYQRLSMSFQYIDICLTSVKSSSRRVRTLATTANAPANSNEYSARDIHLLKHMFFIFVVFLLGWTPICIVRLLSLNEEKT
jgi:hypothetical protein